MKFLTDFISPENKEKAGYTIVIISSLAILSWFVTSIDSDWQNGPVYLAYLWIGVPAALFYGLSLLIAPNPVSPTEAKTMRKGMILVYLVFALINAIIIVIAHIYMKRDVSSHFGPYAPYTIVLALASYAYCYLKYIRNAQYTAGVSVAIPILFLLGMVFGSLGAIALYNNFVLGTPIYSNGTNAMYNTMGLFIFVSLGFWLFSATKDSRK
ncbi:MAG: hypothetical protein HOP08_20635 [Cyclobacteriaceae bacterium]|nr:hypothetical protein [Cyclobacteriaceae bacterium]